MTPLFMQERGQANPNERTTKPTCYLRWIEKKEAGMIMTNNVRVYGKMRLLPTFHTWSIKPWPLFRNTIDKRYHHVLANFPWHFFVNNTEDTASWRLRDISVFDMTTWACYKDRWWSGETSHEHNLWFNNY